MKVYNITLLVILWLLFFTSSISAYTLIDNNNKPLIVTEIKAEVTINNQLATTKLEQTFFNNSSEYIETSYRFTPPEKATIQEFIFIDSDGNQYTGKIDEKEKALAEYHAAQSYGYQTAILNENSPNQFETKAGKVAPNAKCKVVVVYTELLDYKNGVINYKLPFRVSSNNLIGDNKSFITTISVKLFDQKEIVEVIVPNYTSSEIIKKDKNNYLIFYERSDFIPNNDFIVSYKVLSKDMAVSCITTKPEKDEAGYFVLLIAPQEIINEKQIVARDIVFVMDVSGSMMGNKIVQTKRAFNYFLDLLNPNDNFNLITFSSEVRSYFSTLVPVDSSNVKIAKDFLNIQPAAGGTNIYDALQTALKMFKESDRTKAIVFLTDGEPTSGIIDVDRIAKDFKENNKLGVKLFVVGVGNDLNKKLLDKLALENYGDTLYLQEGTFLEENLKAFYDNISKPLLVDISVDFNGLKVFDVYPRHYPNLYKGNQLIISGRYENGLGSTTIFVKGRVNKDQIKIPISANFVKESNENLVVSKVWAKMKADHLIFEMRAYGETPMKKNEVIALSKKYQFITPYTSFVAKTETPVNPPTSLMSAAHNSLNKPVLPVDQHSLPQNTISNQYNYSKSNFNNRSYTQVRTQIQKLPQAPAQNTNTSNIKSIPLAKPLNTGQYQPPLPVVVRSTEARQSQTWGLYSFIPLAAVAIPNFRKAREQARVNACWANCRVLMGAVEMFNMDQPPEYAINELNEYNVKLLYDHGYLKEIPKCLEAKDGKFTYYGTNLASGGLVYCSIHGNPAATKVVVEPWYSTPSSILSSGFGFIINLIIFLIGMYLNIYLFIVLPYRFFMKNCAHIYRYFTNKN